MTTIIQGVLKGGSPASGSPAHESTDTVASFRIWRGFRSIVAEAPTGPPWTSNWRRGRDCSHHPWCSPLAALGANLRLSKFVPDEFVEPAGSHPPFVLLISW